MRSAHVSGIPPCEPQSCYTPLTGPNGGWNRTVRIEPPLQTVRAHTWGEHTSAAAALLAAPECGTSSSQPTAATKTSAARPIRAAGAALGAAESHAASPCNAEAASPAGTPPDEVSRPHATVWTQRGEKLAEWADVVGTARHILPEQKAKNERKRSGPLPCVLARDRGLTAAARSGLCRSCTTVTSSTSYRRANISYGPQTR